MLFSWLSDCSGLVDFAEIIDAPPSITSTSLRRRKRHRYQIAVFLLFYYFAFTRNSR